MALRSSGSGKPMMVDSYKGESLKQENLPAAFQELLLKSEQRIECLIQSGAKMLALDAERITGQIQMTSSLSDSKKMDLTYSNLIQRMKNLEALMTKSLEMIGCQQTLLNKLVEKDIFHTQVQEFEHFMKQTNALYHWKDKIFSNESFSQWIDENQSHLSFSWKEVSNKDPFLHLACEKIKEHKGFLGHHSSALEAMNHFIADLKAENRSLQSQIDRHNTRSQVELNRALRRGALGGVPTSFVPIHSKSFGTMLQSTTLSKLN